MYLHSSWHTLPIYQGFPLKNQYIIRRCCYIYLWYIKSPSTSVLVRKRDISLKATFICDIARTSAFSVVNLNTLLIYYGKKNEKYFSDRINMEILSIRQKFSLVSTDLYVLKEFVVVINIANMWTRSLFTFLYNMPGRHEVRSILAEK